MNTRSLIGTAVSFALAIGCEAEEHGSTAPCANCTQETVDDGAPRPLSPVGAKPRVSLAEGGGGATGAGGEGGGGGEEPWDGVPRDRPLRLAFIGNSFTHQGPIPAVVESLARSVGWPAPEVSFSAPGGESLAGHRTRAASLALVDEGGWDFVVLQDFSTRPTDNIGDPAGFKDDAVWFYDRVKASSPTAEVILYETWARHPNHSIYDASFANPAEMQAQLRFHYGDAADSFIPAQTATAAPVTVRVAPVGDAWERHLGEIDPLRLHAGDDYHAGRRGQYLNGLVLYASIYGVTTAGTVAVGVRESEAARLRAAADATTGIVQPPPVFDREPFAVGRSVVVDFGPVATSEPGVASMTGCTANTLVDAVDTLGQVTGVDVSITDAFNGGNESGLANNGLGLPATVSRDVCWIGSFEGHAEARLTHAEVALEQLAPGDYDLTLFASRGGDDGGAGRLTRYTVQGQSLDLDASDNLAATVSFSGVRPNAAGRVVVEVDVSPAGSARFGYLGALVLEKTGP
ncbi:MAG: hypothetical protein AAGA56_08905 [Myxococcota bacterium]